MKYLRYSKKKFGIALVAFVGVMQGERSLQLKLYGLILTELHFVERICCSCTEVKHAGLSVARLPFRRIYFFGYGISDIKKVRINVPWSLFQFFTLFNHVKCGAKP